MEAIVPCSKCKTNSIQDLLASIFIYCKCKVVHTFRCKHCGKKNHTTTTFLQ